MRVWHNIWGGNARVNDAPAEIAADFRAQEEARRAARRASAKAARQVSANGSPAE